MNFASQVNGEFLENCEIADLRENLFDFLMQSSLSFFEMIRCIFVREGISFRKVRS